uniref:Inositol oxygenase n=1 Tax=Chloropicon laureae TaxID=464258 RepID=A0A7S2YZR9_9CHLO
MGNFCDEDDSLVLIGRSKEQPAYRPDHQRAFVGAGAEAEAASLSSSPSKDKAAPRKRLRVGTLRRNCASESDLLQIQVVPEPEGRHAAAAVRRSDDGGCKAPAPAPPSPSTSSPHFAPSFLEPPQMQQSLQMQVDPDSCSSSFDTTAHLADLTGSVRSLSSLSLSDTENDAASSPSEAHQASWEREESLRRLRALLLAGEDEVVVRQNRARQTVDFVDKLRGKACHEGPRLRCSMWEALTQLLDPAVLEHSVAVAERLRRQFPDKRWLHLCGLVHNLGSVLTTAPFGSQPLWTVAGETFPVGCKFSEDISFSQYFSSNPDRRKRAYNRPANGLYPRHCGLRNVRMSWSGAEWLHTVLQMSAHAHKLPQEALFLIRYQRFKSLLVEGSHYHDLLSMEDERSLELLIEFQNTLEDAAAAAITMEAGAPALSLEDSLGYYKTLVDEYFTDVLH